jgi:hypothetical protein
MWFVVLTKEGEVGKSKVLRRKFVPEKKKVPKVIISVIEFRNSPTDRDEEWIEGKGFHKYSTFPLDAVFIMKTVGKTVGK